MPYIQRNEESKIVGLYARKQDYATDFLPDDNAEVQAYLNPIEYKTRFSSNQYFDRFTEAEQDSIISATDSDMQVRKFYDRMWGSDFIDVKDKRTGMGLDLLISKNLIDASRKETLLEPEIVK